MGTNNQSKYIPFAEYIKNKSPQTSKIKQKLIKEGLKSHMCETCLNTMWNGQPIVLEVHHKDGNRRNNKLDNLQLLCPNCHAMTDNWRGRGKKTSNEQNIIPDEDLINALQESKNIRQALLKVGLSAKGRNYDRAKTLCEKHHIAFQDKNYCKDCGAEISSFSERCKYCENKFRKIEAINDYPIQREELKQLLRTTSFLQIGKHFGVSDNAIRKWCRNLNLPCRSHDIKKMSDEEWALI
jgi:5-methylcytosine-specific restriction endonuclease McrA